MEAAMRQQLAAKRKPEVVAQPAYRRLVVSLPDSLHRRIKLSCASRGMAMAEAIRDALERTPWPVENP
jgi:hypothetical protein